MSSEQTGQSAQEPLREYGFDLLHRLASEIREQGDCETIRRWQTRIDRLESATAKGSPARYARDVARIRQAFAVATALLRQTRE
jgi:hypothetical protein